jgi:maltooligosyltrehalose trehalohydrolase
MAESDLNAPRIILPEPLGGYGLDSQWADDFHHCLHVLITGEKRGYYEDYQGGVEQFAKVWREGFAYTGEYSVYRKAKHGDSPLMTSLHQFVVCAQNHDQVGNRMLGERLSCLTDFESLKLAAGAVLLSPFLPLLFMGEEYGEVAPFPYIVDHAESDLLEAVRKGRKEEFASFHCEGDLPDCGGEEVFLKAKLNHALRRKAKHHLLFEYYRELISIRKRFWSFTQAERRDIEVKAIKEESLLIVTYSVSPRIVLIMNFSTDERVLTGEFEPQNWQVLLDSGSERWGAMTKSERRDPGDRAVQIQGRSIIVYVLS